MLATSLLALVGFAVASVQALTLNVPSSFTDTGFNTMDWVSTPTDPAAFAVEIINEKTGVQVTLLENVKTSDGKVTFNLPGLQEGKGYTLVAHPVGNPAEVLYTSQEFEVIESRVPTTGSSSSTTTGGASVSNPTGGSVTVPTATRSTNTNNAGVPTAPSAAPTFPGQNGEDAAGHLSGSLAAAVIGALAAVLAF